jgi:asparagine synthase (glutamine-hydrolysing)
MLFLHGIRVSLFTLSRYNKDMCGITGAINLSGDAIDQDLLDCMIDALAHRGPDGRGIYLDENVGLGHRRLSILDLSDAGAQPMQSSDGTIIITYNGEIYNFREQRKALELKGYSFRSECDTEVLITLYQEYGTDCLSHLRGMFAFAIYDKEKQRLFCARDRVGQKPFKYFFDGETFLFASELKALLQHSSCTTSVDHEALHHFLTMMYVPSPHTGFQNIHKLEAGNFLLLDLQTKELKKSQYWSLDYSLEDNFSEVEWGERILSALEESVQLQMISDVPIGAFLSGGVDSGAVVSIMARHSHDSVRTYSVGSAEESYNELPEAQIIADRIGSDHHPTTVMPDVVHLLPELVSAYEEPFADPSSIPTFLISKWTSEHVKVALTGDGGDENFAGYIRYPISEFSRAWAKWKILHPLALGGTTLFHQLFNSTFSYRCHRFQSTMSLPWEQRYLQYISFFTEEEKRQMYSDSFAQGHHDRTDAFFAYKTVKEREGARDPLHAALAMDVVTYLADDLMPKVDIASMNFGLECRAPFLDHHFLELTARIPSSLKLTGRKGKHILKSALADILPASHLQRPKSGFRIPLDQWFRSDLKSFVTDQLLSDAPHKWAMFDKRSLEKFLKKYFEGRVDYSDHLWALLWLDEWFRQYTPSR